MFSVYTNIPTPLTYSTLCTYHWKYNSCNILHTHFSLNIMSVVIYDQRLMNMHTFFSFCKDSNILWLIHTSQSHIVCVNIFGFYTQILISGDIFCYIIHPLFSYISSYQVHLEFICKVEVPPKRPAITLRVWSPNLKVCISHIANTASSSNSGGNSIKHELWNCIIKQNEIILINSVDVLKHVWR